MGEICGVGSVFDAALSRSKLCLVHSEFPWEACNYASRGESVG